MTLASRLRVWMVAVALAGIGFRSAAAAEASRTYHGCCDASAAAVLNDDLFAIASDEENVLRLYRRDVGGLPVATVGAPVVPPGAPGKTEADLEGAARLGDLIFWAGSHSRNSDGKPRPTRHVLFATRIRGEGAAARLEAFGRPFRGLITAMVAAPELARFQLARAAERSGEAAGGLNIEALAVGTGDSLLIGFRNPVPEKKALLVPLLNPRETVEGAAARFGSAHLVPLGGLGLRDALRVGDRLLLLAGPAEGGGRHRLYVWEEGAPSAREVTGAVPKGYQAESILGVGPPEQRGVELLSDDGGEKVGGVRCAELRDPLRRVFRVVGASY